MAEKQTGIGARLARFRETTPVRIVMGSLRNVVCGLVVLVFSFMALWWDTTASDASKIARSSIALNAEAVDKSADGKVVSVSGELRTDEGIGDPGYLNFGPYILLNRHVEMFAWVEQEVTEIRTTSSGREVEEPALSYVQAWSADPPNSDVFIETKDHRNPPLSVANRTFKVRTALVGAYRIPAAHLRLPDSSRVTITRKMFVPSLNRALKDDYIYVGRGAAQNAHVGDLRIWYTAVPAGTQVTVFGKLNGDTIEPCVLEEEKTFFCAITGSREEAVADLIPSRSPMTGLIRMAGFFMMWIGLWLSLGPINAAYGLVSVVGNARQFVIGGAMLALAVCLSLLTLLVSAVAHNVVVLVIALVAAAVSAGYGIRKWVRAATGAPSTEQHDTLSLSDHGFEQQENAAANAPAGNSGTASGQIRFACEICNKRYVVPASIAGRKVRCKECGHKFHVPMKSSSKM